jgi:hypothetical protein
LEITALIRVFYVIARLSAVVQGGDRGEWFKSSPHLANIDMIDELHLRRSKVLTILVL